MNPLVLIVGPTASGKSALGLSLAQEFAGGILNCDSLQACQRLDIGSAKPSAAEQGLVPHYLFDIVAPGEVLTAGDFRRRALEVLAREIASKPVFGVGGSGFYIQALEKGMYDVKKPGVAAEQKWRGYLEREGPRALFEELRQRDPDFAASLSPNDSYRVLRALLVIETAGRTATEVRREFRESPIPFPYPLLKLGLAPDREGLLLKVEMRTHAMLNTGLKAEVSALLREGFGEWPVLRSVGYRECVQHLNGEVSAEQLPAKIIEKTMQLAKKQRTWFKRDPEIHWLPVGAPLATARKLVAQFLDTLK